MSGRRRNLRVLAALAAVNVLLVTVPVLAQRAAGSDANDAPLPGLFCPLG